MPAHAHPLLETGALLADLLVGVACAARLAGQRGAWPCLAGLALGAVVATGVTFLEGHAYVGRSAVVLGAELGAGLLAGWFLLRGRRDGAPAAVPARERVPPLGVALVAVAALLAAAVIVRRAQEAPFGDYDAVAIWMKRARFLYEAPERFGEVLAGQIGMPQSCYPLLVPGLVERLWRCCGGEVQLVPVLVGVAAFALVVAAVASTLGRVVGARSGCVGAIVLLGTPFLARSAADRYADVPVGCFYALASCALLRGQIALAGACAGCAAWTKNEGLMFCCCFAAAVLATHPPRARTLLRLGLGMLVPLALVAFFKTQARVGDEYLDRTLAETLRLALDPARAWLVVRELAKETLALGGGLLVALTAIVACVARRPWPRGATTVAVACGVMVLGLALVLVRTPYDLAYDLATTKNRMLMQLWPSWALAMLTALGDPWPGRVRDPGA